jgi:hypothetical protein
LAFLLTWYREYRRSADAYRAPQRQAVADIVAETNELVTRSALAARAIDAEFARGDWVRPGGPIDANQIGPPINDARRAASDLVRALGLGRIVVVDPQCRQALDSANEEMSAVKAFLGQPNPKTFVHAPFYKRHLGAIVNNLEASVAHLVDVSESRLGPVVSLETRLRRFQQRLSLSVAQAAARLEVAEHV